MQQGRILCAAALDESVLLTAGESTVSLSKEMSSDCLQEHKHYFCMSITKS